jgi:membrane protease YdiL (CAAX protease family)
MPPHSAPYRDVPALVFVHLFPLAMSWLYLVAFRRSAGNEPQTGIIIAVAFATAKLVQFSFPALYVFTFERDKLRLVRPSLHGMLVAGGFGLGVAIAILGLFFGVLRHTPWFADAPAKIYRLVDDLHSAGHIRFWLLCALFAIGHSLLEEYYWRWFAFGWLRRYTPVGIAIAVSSLGFMAHHVVLLDFYFPGRFWTLVVPFSLCVATGGAVWAWIYQRTGTLYAPWLSHALIDWALFVVGYAMVAPLLDSPW